MRVFEYTHKKWFGAFGVWTHIIFRTIERLAMRSQNIKRVFASVRLCLVYKVYIMFLCFMV